MDTDHPAAPPDRSATPTVPFVDPLGVESLVALRAEVAQLGARLAGQAPIEQAKGMLMLGYRIPEQRASDMLEGWSQDWDVDVRTVAITMVRTAATGSAEVGRALADPAG